MGDSEKQNNDIIVENGSFGDVEDHNKTGDSIVVPDENIATGVDEADLSEAGFDDISAPENIEPDYSGEEAGDSELDLNGLFEAVLFLSNDPLPVSFFVKHFSIDPTQTRIILDSLIDDYEERDGGIKLIEISNGFQFVTNKKYAERIRRVMAFKRKETLSKSMMETLAIIAYKQPIVLAEIDELRGVSSRVMVANLMKKNLIKPVGRKELPGRPLAYGTTESFLKCFGLNKLLDLPKLSEIKELNFEDRD